MLLRRAEWKSWDFIGCSSNPKVSTSIILTRLSAFEPRNILRHSSISAQTLEENSSFMVPRTRGPFRKHGGLTNPGSEPKRLFEACLATARKRNVIYCIEPLSRKSTNFINTVTDALRLVKEIRHPNFKLIFDCRSASARGEID